MIHSVGMRGAERPEAPVPPLPKGPLASSSPIPCLGGPLSPPGPEQPLVFACVCTFHMDGVV